MSLHLVAQCGTLSQLKSAWHAGGVIGKWRPEAVADEAVKVHFSNPDLLFAGEHPAPRLGQGAFAAALKTLVREVCALALSLHSIAHLPLRADAFCSCIPLHVMASCSRITALAQLSLQKWRQVTAHLMARPFCVTSSGKPCTLPSLMADHPPQHAGHGQGAQSRVHGQAQCSAL